MVVFWLKTRGATWSDQAIAEWMGVDGSIRLAAPFTLEQCLCSSRDRGLRFPSGEMQ
jgi:hypothetical protein